MGYFKFYNALLDLKMVVISTYFNVMIYIEFEHLVYLVNYIFLIKISTFLASSHIFCLSTIESCCLFLFSSIGFIVVSLHDLNTK